MSQYDEKQFLDLLQPYKSEDTKKARRNLSVIGFVVIAAWLLKIQLTDVKVLGVDLSHTSETVVLALGLLLAIYWAVMFYLFLTHDSEIQNERAIQLDKAVSALILRLENHEDYKKQNPTVQYLPHDYQELKNSVEAYDRQKIRTSKAAKYGAIIKGFEIFIPIILATGSATTLIAGIIHTLTR